MKTSLRKSQPKQKPKPVQIPSIKKTKLDDKKTKKLDIKKTGQISYRDIAEKRKPYDKKKQELQLQMDINKLVFASEIYKLFHALPDVLKKIVNNYTECDGCGGEQDIEKMAYAGEKKIKEMIELNKKTLSGIKSFTYYNEGNRIICRDCLYRIEGEIQDIDDEDEGMGYY